MKFKITIIIFFLLLSFSIRADVVSVAFGEKLPPFIIPETDSGIEVDIVREALAVRGHVLKSVFLPMARISLTFKKHKVDVAMMDVGEDMTKLGAFYGTPPVLYNNVFITLKKNHIVIKKPDDLIGRRLNSFIGAQKRYPEWLGKLKNTDEYVEKNDQAVQVLLLNYGRCDVVLSDRNIFKYYTLLAKKMDPKFRPQAIEEHSFTVANPDHYRPVFYSKQIRDDFNFGLKEIRKKGRERVIYDTYLKGDPLKIGTKNDQNLVLL